MYIYTCVYTYNTYYFLALLFEEITLKANIEVTYYKCIYRFDIKSTTFKHISPSC